MRHTILFLALMAGASGCKLPCTDNLPPAAMLNHPGPGVDGPGPGVIAPEMPLPFSSPASQIAFVGPTGTSVAWDVSSPGMFDSEPLVAPARANFPQGAIYRLKLTNIPGRPGVELYPTLEVAPAMPRSDAYLAHNAIPVQFTEEDLDQVMSGNFVTKVLYLPDPEFQELAIAGVETLVSTRLDPGVDPIIEADNRGSILAIVRLGNKDLQVPGAEGEMVGDGFYGGAGMAGGAGPMPCGDGACCPGGGFDAAGAQMAAAAGYPVSGMSAPEWGMPISGTPIGLPGPPHVPLGVPAGLQKHVIKNHTHMHLPHPTRKLRIDVKQSPGMNYPKPPNHAWVHESSPVPPVIFRQPLGDMHEGVLDCPQ